MKTIFFIELLCILGSNSQLNTYLTQLNFCPGLRSAVSGELKSVSPVLARQLLYEIRQFNADYLYQANYNQSLASLKTVVSTATSNSMPPAVKTRFVTIGQSLSLGTFTEKRLKNFAKITLSCLG
jgi:hypothetical protein